MPQNEIKDPFLYDANAPTIKRDGTEIIDPFVGKDAPLAKPPGNSIQAVMEPIVAMGSGIAGTIAGGIGGLAALTTSGPGSRVDRAVDTAESIQSAMQFEPGTQAGDKGVENVANTAKAIAGTINNALANLVDLLDKQVDSERRPAVPREELPHNQLDFSNAIRDEGISRALGDVGFEIGGPAGGTIGEVLPEAVGSLAGVAGRGSKTANRISDAAGDVASDSSLFPESQFGRLDTPDQPNVGRPAVDEPVDFTPREPEAVRIAGDVRRGKTSAAADVDPDLDVLAAADELGVDLNPGHYSNNLAFQEVERAIKVNARSGLEAKERRALIEIGNRADELVERIGGARDKAGLSQEISDEITGTIKQLGDDAEVGYKAVNDAIPQQTRVDIKGNENSAVQSYLDNRLSELGGDESLLALSEKQLLKLVNGEANPTYGALDTVRRNVGNGFQKNRGVFKDDDGATLRRVYGALSEDQQNVARAFNVGDTYSDARGLVATRKTLEDQAVALFGKDLSQSLVPKMKSAGDALTKADVSKFNKLMLQLPEGRRAEVAATLLNDIFTSGSRRGGAIGQGFVAGFEMLNRNPTAKAAFFRYLPEGAEQRFNLIGKVYTSIIRSNQKPLGNPSGSAGPILAALDDPGSLGKIYQGVKKVAAAEGAGNLVGVPGVGGAGAIGAILAAKRTPVLVAADDFLSSPAFNRAIREAAQGNTDVADQVISNSAQFKKWATTINPGDARRIAAVGFIAWLSEEGEQ
jgi:hypothetical protein